MFDDEHPAYQYDVLFTIILWINITALVSLCMNSLPSYSEGMILMFLSLLIMFMFSFIKKRIVVRYDKICMNKRKKTIGNIIFIVEIVITLLSILFLVMMAKQM